MAKEGKSYVSWVLQIIVALILLQTLVFKFAGAQESINLFTRLGMEPWGRLGSGVAELVASALLLWPSMTVFGALLAAGIILGAIFSHLTVLGIEVGGDGGFLFTLAVIALLGSLGILWIHRREIPVIGGWF